MIYVASFGGGLGDLLSALHEDSAYNSLTQFAGIGSLHAVNTCHNPASVSVLRSLRLFDSIVSYPWQPKGPHVYADDYIATLDSPAINLATWDHRAALPDMPFTSFDTGNTHLYSFHLEDEEARTAEALKDMPYIVVHPSGGLQDKDGISRQAYRHVLAKLLHAAPSMRVVAVGASHQRNWVNVAEGEETGAHTETSFDIQHPRFVDLTNKASGALSAAVVRNASAFVGTHSAWICLFWYLQRPTVCIYSSQTGGGNWMDYVLNNNCRWGFYLPWCKAVPASPDVDVERLSNLVINYLSGFFNPRCWPSLEITKGQ